MKVVVIFLVTFMFSELVFANCVDALTSKDVSLFSAIAKRDIDKLKLALEQGADINIRSEYTNTTPLMLAIANGLTDFVKVLVAATPKKDVDVKDIEGNTALMYAVIVGDIEIVKILTKAGANKNEINDKGKSASLIALENIEQSDIDNYSDKVKIFDMLNTTNDVKL